MKGERLGNTSEKEEFFTLDIDQLRAQLTKAQESGNYSKPVVISVPVLGGKVEKFNVYSAPVVVEELAKQYQLGSYVGVGIDDPSKRIRFSVAPNDFQSMIMKSGSFEFIEPANKSKTVYKLHPKTKDTGNRGFLCSMDEDVLSKDQIDKLYNSAKSANFSAANFAMSSDKKYRTLRLALSVTGEYTALFGGTVAGALTQMNATMTRVNGVYEKDFALRLILQNFTNIIYTNGATDPYSPPAQMNNWNLELQQNLTAVVGNANYDIGHLFGHSGGGGNAGCIGCVCVNPASSTDTDKGSGYTSPGSGLPQGDTFDIDYVAHEMGHQLGGTHSFSHNLEGAGSNMEPGSGSTIMGYAGITAANVQMNSDAYFHAKNIDQIQNNLVAKTCDIETAITNNPPVITPLTTYTIPKGTAFVLTASATDPEGNPMTYAWEQYDNASVQITTANLGNTTSGAAFRSMLPTTSPTRYFPRLSSVLAGTLNSSTNWEAVPTVARTMNFRVTVRDNHPTANQQQTQYAQQTINVGGNGPFKVTSTAGYNNSPAALTWDVVGTTAAPYSVDNVKIDYTTNNGTTWTTLIASTPNDGTEPVTFTGVPNNTNVKVRVSAINNVFYAVASVNVTASALCTGTPPTNIVVSAITQTQANVTWDAIAGATYVLQYRPITTPASAWITINGIATTSQLLTGLASSTQYEVQVATVCPSTGQGAFSTSINFTTIGIVYCTANPTSSTVYEYISNVTINPTGAAPMVSNSSSSTYTDYTTDPTRLVKLIIGSTGNTVSVAKVWPGTQYASGTGVWIDYNRNGIFEASERILNSPSNTTTPVTATFAVPASPPTYNGPLTTRMRVILREGGNPDACGTFTWGEVEDYSVQFIQPVPCTSAAPQNLGAFNVTANLATISWTPATGATYVVEYRAVTTPASAWIPVSPAPTNSFTTLTGLLEQTLYEFRVAYVCSGTQGTFSSPYQFTTPSMVWCSAGSTSTATTYAYISNVTTTPTDSYMMSNDSGASNYTDYTTDPTKVTVFVRNTANNKVTISKTWPGTTTGSNYVTVWIDFDRNGIFSTAEKVYSSPLNATTPVTGTFSVPLTAYNGPYTSRMRVLLHHTSMTTACGTFVGGEVEDYPVRFKDLTACSTTVAPTNLTVVNITPQSAMVSWMGSTGATYSIRYRPVTTPVSPWITITSTSTNIMLSPLTEQTQYQVQVANICGTTVGNYSNIVTFTTPAMTWCPTTSVNTTFTYGYISNVSVLPFNAPAMSNASGSSNYTSYTADPTKLVNLVIGSANNTITVSRTWSGTPQSSYISIWIDYNRNGTFETTERINTPAPYNVTNPYNFTFTVPLTAYNGPLKSLMRVVVHRTSMTTACGNFADGEVEDYAVKFIQLAPCTTAVPSNIAVTNITQTSAAVSWLGSTGATYIVRYREVGSGTWITSAAVPNSPFIITGLTEQTNYEVQVATICGGVTGSFSPSEIFTTPPMAWCPVTTTATTLDEHITNVTVTPDPNFFPFNPAMSNNSGASNYTDYYLDPSKLITLVLGSQVNTLSISKGWINTPQSNVALAVWIDFNRNGVFETAEKIHSSAANQITPINATFIVPPTGYTSPFNTKMRVIARLTTIPTDPCVNFADGEIEDYPVKLVEEIPCNNAAPTNVTVSAITHNTATVNWTADVGGATYIVQYKPVGATTWTAQIPLPSLTSTYTIPNLIAATPYVVQVIALCDNIPGTATEVPFETKCDPAPPTNFTVTAITTTSAQVTWDPVATAVYVLQYRPVGSLTWITVNLTATSYTLTGLLPYTTYEVQVASECSGAINPYTTPEVFTTLPTCEMAPVGLTVTNITMTQAQVDWNLIPGATYVLKWRKVGSTNWTTVNLATNTYLLTGLTEQTQYEVQIANVCNGTTQLFTHPYVFTTPTLVYCDMTSADSSKEHISNVTVKPTNSTDEMINDSGASNYTSYVDTGKIVLLIQGSVNNQISVTKKWASTQYNEAVTVWIDYNRDGNFSNSERILISPSNQNTPVTGTFNVPSDAYASLSLDKYVVMRVAMRRGGSPEMCSTFDNGEVEDYKVYIKKAIPLNIIDPNLITIYPNPTKNVLNITNVDDGSKFTIYSAIGRLVQNGVIITNKIDVSRLINGVYIIDIETVKGIRVQKKFIKE